jgi:dUTP pyrophosphatase
MSIYTEDHDQKARMEQLTKSNNATCKKPCGKQTKKVLVKRLDESATIPTKAHDHDAGWDLYANESTYILPNHRRTISTGISLEIPKGHVGLIWPRSGLAVKNGIDVFAGVIDSGYRGEIKVCLYNSSDNSVKLNAEDRVAQIIIQKLPNIEMLEVQDLQDSNRGEGGFGSSGA